jgi:hypothetical protein
MRHRSDYAALSHRWYREARGHRRFSVALQCNIYISEAGWALFAAFLPLSSAVYGQVSAALLGTVTDQSGALVSAANNTATETVEVDGGIASEVRHDANPSERLLLPAAKFDPPRERLCDPFRINLTLRD